ncbi:hypothetical protein JOB18_001677 [Solea senegalensis]|uniref:Uncharacterized protein n=1 Tax=Solea senegalensis TaxID=28829 RepID=A0AAV6SQ12_SOLSE|nr:hypothetical protein JOB18_001677 [Solea senegalensis]
MKPTTNHTARQSTTALATQETFHRATDLLEVSPNKVTDQPNDAKLTSLRHPPQQNRTTAGGDLIKRVDGKVQLLQVPFVRSDYHPPPRSDDRWQKADRQPLPRLFTANIAFKEMLSVKAPEHGPDIAKDPSLKDGVFIVTPTESDNSWHLPAFPEHLTLAHTEVFVFDLLYFSLHLPKLFKLSANWSFLITIQYMYYVRQQRDTD